MTPSARALLRILDERIARFERLHERAQADGDTVSAVAYRGWTDATRAARRDAETFLLLAEGEARHAILDDPAIRAEIVAVA